MKRNLLSLADKIKDLKEEDVKQINAYLKILESHWNIKLTDAEQMRRAGKSMKDGVKKFWDVISDD